MSSKAEILKDVYDTYNKYKPIFDFAKIKEETFLRWVDGFKSYEELRKLNTYIHGGSQIRRFTKQCLLRNLMICQEAYKHFTPEQWERLLFLATSNHRQVVILKQAMKEFKENWKNRPRPRRRSSE